MIWPSWWKSKMLRTSMMKSRVCWGFRRVLKVWPRLGSLHLMINLSRGWKWTKRFQLLLPAIFSKNQIRRKLEKNKIEWLFLMTQSKTAQQNHQLNMSTQCWKTKIIPIAPSRNPILTSWLSTMTHWCNNNM